MGALISSAACCAGEAACCLSCMCCSKILSSLCSCGGSEGKAEPSAGRKRSVAVVLLSLLLSLALQFLIVPNVGSWDRLDFAWSCSGVDDAAQEACRQNSAVYRVSMVAATFFLLSALAAAASPQFNKNHWGAKIGLYLLLLVASMFTPAAVFDGYLSVARVGAAVFVVLQQVILIDLAYNWNDSWVAKSDADEKDLMGAGDSWLKAILGAAAFMFVLAYASLGFLFHYFGGCGFNDAALWITLVLTLMAVAFQLTGDEGSVLTSGVMALYAV
ncbi:hypothetical protein TeGR_g14564, partial [Tetraparma gracilis]